MSEQELAAQRAANEESFLEWCADYWRSKLCESNEYVARLYDVRPEHLFGIPVKRHGTADRLPGPLASVP